MSDLNPGPKPFLLTGIPDTGHAQINRFLDAYIDSALTETKLWQMLWHYPIGCQWIETYLTTTLDEDGDLYWDHKPDPAPEALDLIERASRLSPLASSAALKAFTTRRRDSTHDLGRHPFNDPAEGAAAFRELHDAGILGPAPPEDTLRKRRVAQLRDLLAKYDLPTKGKKADLVAKASAAIHKGLFAFEDTVSSVYLAIIDASPEVKQQLPDLLDWRENLLRLYVETERQVGFLQSEIHQCYEMGRQYLIIEDFAIDEPCEFCAPLINKIAAPTSLSWGTSRTHQLLPVHPGCRCTADTYFRDQHGRRALLRHDYAMAAWEYKMRLAGFSDLANR